MGYCMLKFQKIKSFWDSYGYIAGVTKVEYFEEIKNKINCTKKATEEIPFGVKRAVTKTKDFCWIQDMKIIYKTKDNKLINFYSSYSCEFLIGIDTKLLSILSDEKNIVFIQMGLNSQYIVIFKMNKILNLLLRRMLLMQQG